MTLSKPKSPPMKRKLQQTSEWIREFWPLLAIMAPSRDEE